MQRRHQGGRKAPGNGRRRPRPMRNIPFEEIPQLPVSMSQLDSGHDGLPGDGQWMPPASHTKCPECRQMIPVDTLVTHVLSCLQGDKFQGLLSPKMGDDTPKAPSTASGKAPVASLPQIGAFVIRGPDFEGHADGWDFDICSVLTYTKSRKSCLPLGIVPGHTEWLGGEFAALLSYFCALEQRSPMTYIRCTRYHSFYGGLSFFSYPVWCLLWLSLSA